MEKRDYHKSFDRSHEKSNVKDESKSEKNKYSSGRVHKFVPICRIKGHKSPDFPEKVKKAEKSDKQSQPTKVRRVSPVSHNRTNSSRVVHSTRKVKWEMYFF